MATFVVCRTAMLSRVRYRMAKQPNTWKYGLRFLQGILGAIFQQDNARPHVAKTVQDFCLAHMQLLPWPAYSLNMPPNEHVWDFVGRRLARDPAASKDELWLCKQAIQNSLPQTDIQNLFDFIQIVQQYLLQNVVATPNADFGHLFFFFFDLKIQSIIFTNTIRLCFKFHLIVMIPSWYCILYAMVYMQRYAKI